MNEHTEQNPVTVAPGQSPEPFLDIRTVAKLLSMSPRTVRAWVHDEERPLPAYDTGGRLLFRWSQIEEFMHGLRVIPFDPSAHTGKLLQQIKRGEV